MCNYITIEEGNGNPLQYSCLENPIDKDPELQSMVSQSWTWLKWLSTCTPYKEYSLVSFAHICTDVITTPIKTQNFHHFKLPCVLLQQIPPVLTPGCHRLAFYLDRLVWHPIDFYVSGTIHYILVSFINIIYVWFWTVYE